MPAWLPLALFALIAWAIQRLLSKVALGTLGTRKFYLLSAAVSLGVYIPYLVVRPPAIPELFPAFGLACLMAVTFGVTTEALRRGPLGAVSPITALSPALTAMLAVLFLRERLSMLGYLGIALAPVGIVLLSLRGGMKREGQLPGWELLAVISLMLQGLGAFIAKLVVSPAGCGVHISRHAASICLEYSSVRPPNRGRLTMRPPRPDGSAPAGGIRSRERCGRSVL